MMVKAGSLKAEADPSFIDSKCRIYFLIITNGLLFGR